MAGSILVVDDDSAVATVLTAMLPSPRKRDPRHPTRPLRRRAAKVLALFGTYHQLAPHELAHARSRLRMLFGRAALAAQ